MLKLLVLYAHLLATCLALGTIALTDARILARAAGYKVVIPPPSLFESRAIALALLLLVASGGALIALADGPALANPKLQGKLLLVAVLAANALVLHRAVFPLLESLKPLARWSAQRCAAVALAVGLSNSLWLYCAFLGIARPWNHSVSLAFVLGVALVLWLLLAVLVRAVLWLAARAEPHQPPDWIDSMKATLSGLSGPAPFDARARAFDDAALEPSAGALPRPARSRL
jgi:hypothetical protein